MAKYKITAPDGRTVIISGDRAPTEADLPGIFAQIPSKTPEQEYGADNVARARKAVSETREDQDSEIRPISAVGRFFGENKTGRAATSVLQGLNKGNPLVQLGSFVAPSINDDVIDPENGLERALELGAEFATPAGVYAKGAGMAAKAPKVANLLSKSKVGRAIGSLLTPAAMPLEYAGAAGAGALTGAVNPETTVGKIATGLVGGLTGAGLVSLAKPGALKGMFTKSTERLDKNTARAINKLESAVGRDKLQEMLGSDRSLLEQGGTSINDLARQARDVSPQAADKLVGALETRQLDTPTMVRRQIDDIFGSKNTLQNAEDLTARLDPIATAKYEQAFTGSTMLNPQTGKLRTVSAKLPAEIYDKLNRDPYIRDAITTAPTVHKELQSVGRKAIKDNMGKIIRYESIEAPRNEMRRLDFAKEVLDNQIAREMASPAPNTRLVASLTASKNKLVASMDEFSPAYKSGRAVSQQKLSALESQKAAASWNNSDVSVDKFRASMDSMSPESLESFRIGLRDKIKQSFEHNNPEVFARSLLNTDAKEKLRLALGDEAAGKLIGFADNLRAQKATRERVMGGSMTSTNQQGTADVLGTVEQVAASPIKAPGRMLARAFDTNRAKNTYNALADLLLANPKNIKLPEKTRSTILSDILKNTPRIGPAQSVAADTQQ